MNIIPFMNSATYIEHYNLTEFYVTDLKIEDDMEQLVNIQPLEEYLKKKNPERLQELQEKFG